jgi:hypothetical protein
MNKETASIEKNGTAKQILLAPGLQASHVFSPALPFSKLILIVKRIGGKIIKLLII